MEGLEDRFIDGIFASSEAFLYGINKLLTRFVPAFEDYEEHEGGFPYKKFRFNLEKSLVFFVEREKLVEQTIGMSESIFQDALLLSGSNILEPIPLLAGMEEDMTFRDVTQLLMAPAPRTAMQLCTAVAQHPLMKETDYVNKYKRALASIKHPIINSKDGDIGPLDKEHAPSDLHDCVGLQLPWELLHYLKLGMVSPHVLSQLTTGLIHIRAPLGGGGSKPFREFVRNGLDRIRKQSLNLLTGSLNRWYARREIRQKYYFDRDHQSRFTTHDLPDLPKSLRWHATPLPAKLTTRMTNVRSLSINWYSSIDRFFQSSIDTQSLYFLLENVADEAFAKRTLTSDRQVNSPFPLKWFLLLMENSPSRPPKKSPPTPPIASSNSAPTSTPPTTSPPPANFSSPPSAPAAPNLPNKKPSSSHLSSSPKTS